MHKMIDGVARLRGRAADAGMTTVEYAVGTLAAAALGAVLYQVVQSPGIQAALLGMIERSLK